MTSFLSDVVVHVFGDADAPTLDCSEAAARIKTSRPQAALRGLDPRHRLPIRWGLYRSVGQALSGECDVAFARLGQRHQMGMGRMKTRLLTRVVGAGYVDVCASGRNRPPRTESTGVREHFRTNLLSACPVDVRRVSKESPFWRHNHALPVPISIN